jgi:hypothetical protein
MCIGWVFKLFFGFPNSVGKEREDYGLIEIFISLKKNICVKSLYRQPTGRKSKAPVNR